MSCIKGVARLNTDITLCVLYMFYLPRSNSKHAKFFLFPQYKSHGIIVKIRPNLKCFIPRLAGVLILSCYVQRGTKYDML